MKIQGTTTYVEVEGGFWGILGDDGVPYHPLNGLPQDFQREALRVSAQVSPSNKVSIHMWGRLVDLKSIERLDK